MSHPRTPSGVPYPEDEPGRLEAVETLRQILQRDDPRLTRLARLTSALMGVPNALVTLVDRTEQQVYAFVGDANDAPREHAFCSHVVGRGEMLIVEDATGDARFVDSPLVTVSNGIRFYAGAPLRTPDGHAVGALCAVDHQPRAFSAHEQQVLADLASLASDELSARMTSNVLTEAAARLQHIVGMASHDLRGALGAMIGYAGLLKEMLPPGGDAAEFAATIESVGHRATALMQELLETAMLESGTLQMDMAPFDLAALVRTAGRDFLGRAHLKGQQILCLGPASVLAVGDARRLRQVLDNLISNALKFSPQGATVRLHVTEAPTGFVVEDEGPGFQPAERERAFHPFARISNVPTGDEPSTGLGLSIAAELVRLHRGEIRIEEGATGRGTRFVVTLG